MDTEGLGGFVLKFLEISIFAIGAHFCDKGRDFTFKCTLLQVFIKSSHDLPQLLKLLAELLHVKLHRCTWGHYLLIQFVVIIVKGEPLEMSFNSCNI